MALELLSKPQVEEEPVSTEQLSGKSKKKGRSKMLFFCKLFKFILNSGFYFLFTTFKTQKCNNRYAPSTIKLVLPSPNMVCF